MTRRWQTRREQASHTDDWLITYADMITLLLCLFVIYVGITATRKDSAHKAPAPQTTIAAAVTAPIPPPVPLPPDPSPAPQLPAKVLEALQVIPPFHDDEQVDHPVAGPAPAMPAKTDEAPRVAQGMAGVAKVPPPETEEARNEAPAAAPVSLPDPAHQMKPQSVAEIEPKGDRITTIEMSSATFFDSGSAVLSSPGKAILQEVAAALSSDRLKGYQVTVEGHTDDTPINTPQFPSNWELSTARASAVVRFFLEQGIPAQRLRAAGYADTFPKAPNRDAAGNPIPENQAQNRRVVIKLEKIDPQKQSAGATASKPDASTSGQAG